MLTYLQWGLWAAKRCVLSGLIVFIAYQGFLMLIKKRTPRQYKEFPKMLLVAEFLLSVYILKNLKMISNSLERKHMN